MLSVIIKYMKNLYKTILGWSMVGLAVVAAVFLIVSINQKLNTATTTNTVSFTGEGKVLAKPDIAVIDLSVVTQSATSKDAQNQNSIKTQKITSFLKAQKIADKDIKTAAYNIYPQYKYPRNGSPEIDGYQVNETIEVKIRNLDQVSAIVDGAVTAGANQVNGPTFQIENPEKLKAQARAQAIADAKSKANSLQSQLDIHLGKIINFYENTGGYPIMYEKATALGLGGGMGGAPTPSLPSGENEITVDVTLTYQIK
jgi:uncharacterized protein YggE